MNKRLATTKGARTGVYLRGNGWRFFVYATLPGTLQLITFSSFDLRFTKKTPADTAQRFPTAVISDRDKHP